MGRFFRWLGAVLSLGGAAVFGARTLGDKRDSIDDDDEIDLVATLATRHLRSVSESFMGGTITVMAGIANLDLRQAAAGPTGAELAIGGFGGVVRLTIPSHWHTIARSEGWMSSVLDQSQPAEDPDAPVLRVRSTLRAGRLIIESLPQLRAVS
ncbi:MAG: hypothetical protein GEU79_07230 [Acidimicrobiia bacterium]|nr:hypothetical protein [Acidimicrobiia bacterium]